MADSQTTTDSRLETQDEETPAACGENESATSAARTSVRPLTAEQIEEASAYFRRHLIGQPEVVRILTDLLYRQAALFKRIIDNPQQPGAMPHDPTVLLFAGGSWGKTRAARLIPEALRPLGFAPFSVLTPLPQDIEGTIDIEPQVFMIPHGVVLLEHLERAWMMNERFIANLSHVLEAGVYPVADPQSGAVRFVPLGLTTFIFTTSVGENEIKKVLHAEGQLGFLRREDLTPEQAYEQVRRVVEKKLEALPEQILRHVDETVIFRPLADNDLSAIFDCEIENYEHSAFPGKVIQVNITPEARDRLFEQALEGLALYGTNALRRTLQRQIDSLLYRAYVRGDLSEQTLGSKAVNVMLSNGAIEVSLAET